MIDLRSDTITQPTKGMLDAMMSAPVGDDVFGDDPTINALEEKAAELFGMEAALFCPSGTMTNQIAIKALTQPMDEVICHRLSHIYNYEGGGIAFNSGISMRLIEGNRGLMVADDIRNNINEEDIHKPVTTLVGLENTCNKGGGCYYDFEVIKEIADVCTANDLKLHLDGARLYNAIIETPETAHDYGQAFDTISLCLSKGLGCPVGSLLICDAATYKKAKRIRKVFGGGWRQAGYLAAAGIYALDNNIDRIKDDHRRAKALGQALEEADYIKSVMPVDTNIVIYELGDKYDKRSFLSKLKEYDILAVPMSARTMRFVTHLGIDDNGIDEVITALRKL